VAPVDGLILIEGLPEETSDEIQDTGGDPAIHFVPLLGDCNGNGVLQVLDAQCALKMSVQLIDEDLQLDIDRDGQVSAEDARRILSAALSNPLVPNDGYRGFLTDPGSVAQLDGQLWVEIRTYETRTKRDLVRRDLLQTTIVDGYLSFEIPRTSNVLSMSGAVSPLFVVEIDSPPVPIGKEGNNQSDCVGGGTIRGIYPLIESQNMLSDKAELPGSSDAPLFVQDHSSNPQPFTDPFCADQGFAGDSITVTYPKLESYLDQLATGQLSEATQGDVPISIVTVGPQQEITDFIEDSLGMILNEGPGFVEATLPPSALGSLHAIANVGRVDFMGQPDPDAGGVTSLGLSIHNADHWHSHGYEGSGVRVGVIDTQGFLGYQALSDTAGYPAPVPVFPPNTVNQAEVPSIQGNATWNHLVAVRCYGDSGHSSDLSQCDQGSDHGTAVAQALVDIAPSVDLYLTNPRTRAELRDAVNWLVDQHVHIINQSISWPWEGPGDGIPLPHLFQNSVLETVEIATDAGVVWVNSAGNWAQLNWFGDFADTDGNGVHEWDVGGDEFNGITLEADTTVRVEARWSGTWGGDSPDIGLSLYEVKPTGARQLVAQANGVNQGQMAVPLERLYYTCTN
jgi:hypothetical protein